MTPFFTVIIPTFNRAERLVRALSSVQAQSWTGHEVIVIDDGDDGTERLVRDGWRVDYQRGPGRGVAAARNQGARASAGTHLAFLDADDYWYPGKLAAVADVIARQPEVGLVYSLMDYVDAQGRRLWTTRASRLAERHAYLALLRSDFVGTSAAVVRRDSFEAVGGFDERLRGCEDWDLWIRLARQYPVGFAAGSLVAYEHLSEGSFTGRHHEWIANHDEVVDKALSADPALTRRQRNGIRAAVACTKGRISLSAGDEALARRYFTDAIAADVSQWRAWVYRAVLSWAPLRRALPRVITRLLRLPTA
jgi:glycosyltransferase involved in cell wall biosynthesis